MVRTVLGLWGSSFTGGRGVHEAWRLGLSKCVMSHGGGRGRLAAAGGRTLCAGGRERGT